MRRFLVALILLFALQMQLQAQTCQFTLQDLKQNPGAPPTEVNTGDGPGTCGFLKFSWRAFFAMNWPAVLTFDRNDTTKQTRGLPDTSKLIGQGSPDTPTVWELFQPNWYIFAPNNPPSPGFAGWNQEAALPSSCGQIMQAAAARLSPEKRSTLKMLSALSKFDAMPGVIQARSSAPLLDQQGFYTRYEIRTSFESYSYIVDNKFYLEAAQENQTFKFPVQSGSKPGAIFLKAAWKTLSAEEERSGRFHTARAFMFTPSLLGVQSTCVGPVPVGLVGLHIVQKTEDFPQWIWATFEQVDNTPADPASAGAQSKWSYFKPGSTKPMKAPDCPTSLDPCQDWQPTSAHLLDSTGGPTQVLRLNAIPASQNQPSLDQLNQSAQNRLREINPSSVWQFYRLVEAQWERADTPTGFFPPRGVANATMETYTQKISCMACHKPATAANGTTRADFTFELSLGWRPVVLPPDRIPTPVP